jgi:hypothetical protein
LSEHCPLLSTGGHVVFILSYRLFYPLVFFIIEAQEWATLEY